MVNFQSMVDAPVEGVDTIIGVALIEEVAVAEAGTMIEGKQDV